MPGILCSVQVPAVQDTHGLTGEGLKEGQEDDQSIGEPDLSVTTGVSHSPETRGLGGISSQHSST